MSQPAPPPHHSLPDDATLRRILQRTRVIAVIGVSANPVRPSYFVARYLSLRGFTVIPVNPGHAGQTLFGQTVRASLAECPDTVEMLDVFRRSDQVPPIVAEGIERFPRLKTIWLQIGVESPQAQAMAQAHGLDFVHNRCPKIEYQRLFGELRMGGFNTGIISSKL
ncbi:MAG: CoA-binding protein [Pararhodobacter sp.]